MSSPCMEREPNVKPKCRCGARDSPALYGGGETGAALPDTDHRYDAGRGRDAEAGNRGIPSAALIVSNERGRLKSTRDRALTPRAVL